eukprot:4525716-Prymnesium_polylepis.1
MDRDSAAERRPAKGPEKQRDSRWGGRQLGGRVGIVNRDTAVFDLERPDWVGASHLRTRTRTSPRAARPGRRAGSRSRERRQRTQRTENTTLNRWKRIKSPLLSMRRS